MAKARRIAWILHGPYVNEGRVYKESQTLSKAGYEVTIFATWKKGLPLIQNEGNVKIVRLAFPVLCALKVPVYAVRLFMPLYTLRLLLFELRRYKPDVLHCMNIATLHIGYLSKKLFNIPYVYDSHDLFVGQIYFSKKSAIVQRLYMLREKFLAKRAAVVIQADEGRSKHFQKLYGITPKVIINKALVPTSSKKVLSEDDYPMLKTSKYKLVSVGAIAEQRGVEQLVEATAGMDNVQIFLLGRPISKWGYDLLERYKDQLCWIPAVAPGDVTNALMVFDLGVSLVPDACLSRYLGSPTKMWELIASGMPQIASDFPDIRKTIVENEVGPVGRVVDPADVGEIRRNIQEMLDNPNEMEMYRKNCLKLRQVCGWNTEAGKLIEIYKTISK
jgi:glycosyltransferase involved in cell wall biosynthesis